ncbi:uncharacterized protein Dana_GF14243 [Drosophila ananassae]|uniref:NACHT domain-containing protein n=1 Tax=Drosophila ananassae TaxID=7217 RepID=B3MN52_DROAN|nr:uncharacterized protein LOC6497071 [Drosophila ananassae]XP_032311382.1 uncharacterized protein LOC6497071 [Drosophila ananassae]EDV32030.1 uncharacterized protein Dana_GF14243 [Drosophila ananassae]
MGNVCSSGQKKKKDKDSASEKSDDSPPYQEADQKDTLISTDTNAGDMKRAPLAAVEALPEVTPLPENNGNQLQAQKQQPPTAQGKSSGADKDSSTTTPQGAQAPSDVVNANPGSGNLSVLQGKPPPSRKIERDKKIVVYILADNSTEYKKHKRVVHSLYKHFKSKCQSRGFDFIISDVHDSEPDTELGNGNGRKDFSRLQEVKRWTQTPLEAQGGHEEAANCLCEITRHSAGAYIVPVLFLGATLGTPMLPLTIESQDFTSVLGSASEAERLLLEKWYTIDNSYQPMCHRLHAQQVDPYSAQANGELNELLAVLLRLFSDDVKDSYLTTVVEQEINNTVLMSQELAKRCIWIQTGAQLSRAPENATQLELEVQRRISRVYSELKSQLCEKNLIRLLPTMSILDEELSAVIESLLDKAMAGIFEEHQQKSSIPYNTLGVDRVLLEELQLIGHYSKLLAQNSANFDIMNDVKRYIRDSTAQPLVISGARGCGKSVLVSKIMENVHRWKPEAQLILRYANLSARSSDLTSLLGSMANQMSVLETGHQCQVPHTLAAYSEVIREILGRQQRFFVLIVDGVDELQREETLEWLPQQLGNSKIILTVSELEEERDDADASGNSVDMLAALAQLGIPQRCFLRLRQFTERQWHDILSSGGGDFYAANGALKLPDEWKTLHGKTPYHAKSLWWLAWLGHVAQPISEIGDISGRILQVLESKFATDQVELLLLIVRLSPWGIRESDCLGVFQKMTQLEAQVAFKIWSKFCWLMGPMLLGLKNIRIADRSFGFAVLARYAQKQWLVHEALRDYFDRQDSEFKGIQGANTYNYQKYLKLPYHHFCAVIEDKPAPHKIDILFNCFYFTDLPWIANKVHATGPDHLLNDILQANWLATNNANDSAPSYVHINFLKEFLEQYLHELSYDGKQFYTLMKYYLKTRFRESPELKDDEKIRSWWECTNELEFAFLEILNADIDAENGNRLEPEQENATVEGEAQETNPVKGYDVLMNLPQPGCYVASLCTERAEICIWDVKNCCRIRELQGIQQPTAMCPVGNYEAAVLCRREIRVINLDEGKFKVTLKGVMNQKMPYFGLHDQNHLVCLSRNRMYVNLMNLESGDCVTTFKAGEDRFLNSLLVSGDGRILVCGDETQKPFPLLVWHLSQRKLLYDLRIPHHDFITSLSAITHEGSYVCVVAKELNEPTTPNFIVVYDLQSGTLFKKWKPSCNTVSLAISQVNACVIAGLEDSKILIWDLVTGNCKSTLIGHNAPVTFLKLDPLGKVLLSYDKEGRDTAIRMWELNSAKSLAVFKPPAQVSTCEILPNGAFVVLALKDRNALLTLALKNYGGGSGNVLEDDCGTLYGNPDNQRKVFDLSN